MLMLGKNEIIERMRAVGSTLGEHHDVVAVGGTALTPWLKRPNAGCRFYHRTGRFAKICRCIQVAVCGPNNSSGRAGYLFCHIHGGVCTIKAYGIIHELMLGKVSIKLGYWKLYAATQA